MSLNSGCCSAPGNANLKPPSQPDTILAVLSEIESFASGIRATANMIAENMAGCEPSAEQSNKCLAESTVLYRLKEVRNVLSESEYHLSRTTRAIPL